MQPTEGDRRVTDDVATLSGYRTEGRRLAQAAVALFHFCRQVLQRKYKDYEQQDPPV